MRYRIALAALAASVASCTGAAVAADVEVIHWWTSGGEQAAVSVFAKEFDALGGDKWVDTAIAGGEQARAATMQRVLGNDAPEAAQFNTSRQFEELIEADKLLDLTELAEKEGWAKFIRPAEILAPCTKEGRIYCVPVNIHSNQWIWTNKEVYKKAGVAEPATWQDIIDSAPKIREAGFIPLAFGGQGWQENLTFGDVFLGVAGKDLWYKVWKDKDVEAAGGPEMLKVFETFGQLRDLVDEGSPGRNWNDATNLVITGKAAAQVMGDWARGEFAVAGKVADVDYGCIPGPSTKPYLTLGGDSFLFPKQDDPAVEAAQLKMASMMVNPVVQAKFNNAKGSLPIRDDVDLGVADACMKKGLELLKNPEAPVQPANALLSADADGQVQDVISQFWNNKSMTAEEAQKQFVEIIRNAD
jgi:glucose/mannose transport system substrate-binding protein